MHMQQGTTDNMQKPNKLSEVWQQSAIVITEIERWLVMREDRHVKLNFAPLDQARLLKLAMWGRRYSVEIHEILDLILPILRGQVRQSPYRKRSGIGVTVPALTGPAAERILNQELKKK